MSNIYCKVHSHPTQFTPHNCGRCKLYEHTLFKTLEFIKGYLTIAAENKEKDLQKRYQEELNERKETKKD